MSAHPKSYTRQIIAKVEQLPPLPLVIQQLLNVMDDERASARDMARVLATDQALSGKILKLVNSSFYGFSGKISTITRAVVIVGFAGVRSLALGLAAYNALKNKGSALNRDRFWQHALYAAAGARALAKRQKYAVPEKAFIAGLLHDLGRLILDMAFPEAYATIIANPTQSLIIREEEALGMAHTEAGALLMEHWRLPEEFRRVARFHHSPKRVAQGKDPLLTIAVAGDLLSRTHGNSCREALNTEFFCQAITATGVPMRDFGAVLNDMEDHAADAMTFLNTADTDDVVHHGNDDASRSELSTVAMMGGDETQQAWTKCLLEHFGYHVQVLHKADVETLTETTAGLFILDPPPQGYAQIASLHTYLKEKNIPLVLLLDTSPQQGAGESPLKPYSTLPFVFSQTEANTVLRKET